MRTVCKNILSFYANLSLRKKLAAILAVSICVISMSGFLGLHIISKAYLALLEETVANNLSYSAVTISDYLHYIENMSAAILSDSVIQQNLIINNTGNSRQQGVAYQSLSDSVYQYYIQSKSFYVDCITLHTPKNTIYSNFLGNCRIPDDIAASILKLSQDAEGRPVWIFDYAEENGFCLGRLIRNAQSPSFAPLGTLIIRLDIHQLLVSLNLREGNFSDAGYFISSNGNIIYHADETTRAIRQQAAGLSDSHYELLTINNHKYFVYSTLIPDWDLTYTCYLSYDSVFHSTSIAWMLGLIIILLTSLIVLLLSQSMIAFISRHTGLLVRRMQAFNAQDTLPESDYDYSQRKDEFGLLNRQFDHMANRIHHLIQVNYVNELWKKDAQLKALEMQIQPHFLYNTLESINWRAKAAGNTEIAHMAKSLGNLLRASLSEDTGEWTLKKELDMLDSYITIQKYRFEEHLDYASHYDAALLGARIPKFIIQPLVENAIHYGLEECVEVCRIEVTILLEPTDHTLHMFVKNNGSQFEENILARLQAKELQSQGLGIGLINIDERIKLMFGPSYGLKLYNEGEKAVARIIIPHL